MNEAATLPSLVSVIIPVCNTAPYLRQCLDSVVGQTLREIEIICVDDGSVDGSPEILREYVEKDPRVIILTEALQSPGAARNKGLDKATGQYVIFWDSDDWFEPDALECMYRLCAERYANLCVCGAQDFDDATGLLIDHNYTRKPYPETDTFNARDCRDRIFSFTSTVCWNKMIQRQLLLDHDIRFPEKTIFEDGAFSMLVLLLSERITICTRRLVHYRVNRPGSIMSDYSHSAEGILQGCMECYRQLSERGLLDDEMIRRSFLDKIAGLYLYTLPLGGAYEQYKEYYDKVFLTDDNLLWKWDAAWDPMADASRYMEARKLTPEEYLLQQLNESRKQNLKHNGRIRKLEKEKKDCLAKVKKYRAKEEELLAREEAHIAEEERLKKLLDAAEKELLAREEAHIAEEEKLKDRLHVILRSKAFRMARIVSPSLKKASELPAPQRTDGKEQK